MSRGPGKWQRAILQRLDTCGWMLLHDVLAVDHTRSQVRACRRALNGLVAQGRVRTARLRRHGWTHAERRVLGETVVLRPGVQVDHAHIYETRIRPPINKRYTWEHEALGGISPEFWRDHTKCSVSEITPRLCCLLGAVKRNRPE
jgi:hypothetical protein